MKPIRKLIDARRRRGGEGKNRLEAATRVARAEAQAVVRSEREEKLRAAAHARAERMERLGGRVRGAGTATAGWLRPVGTAGRGALAVIAPHVSRALLAVVRIPVIAIAALLDLSLQLAASLRRRLGPILAAAGALAERHVTPRNTVAVVALGAAVALGASQFIDYRGLAVGAQLYQDDPSAASVAPVPMTGLEQTGSAHLYAMVPLAVIAIALIVLTLRGRWELGRAIALIGLAGVAVALLIDRPQALEAGTTAGDYSSGEPQLLDGFWAQIAASVGLIALGPLLASYTRAELGDGGRERVPSRWAQRRPGARRRTLRTPARGARA